ncbi:PAS domain-containing protein [Phenylobacterium sp.]|uniref:PAS domain-containing protein n=1 Tax=Phenylobacterium sp. TaxID=1871053 RepID=UPI0030F45584
MRRHDWADIWGDRDAFPSVAGQGFYQLLDEVYATGETYQAHGAEVRYRREPEAPEEIRHLDFIYAPITDEAGAVTGIFCDGYDVTTRRHADEELRRLNAELERRVIERPQARGVTWQVSPDLLGALSSEGYFETSNPACQSMLGMTSLALRVREIIET